MTDAAAITIILQVITLLIAGVGPFLAYRHARKLAISQGRQAWLNELRAETSELIARADIAATLSNAKTPDDVQRFRDNMLHVQSLRIRILLRLEPGNPRHDRLRDAIETFVANTKTLGEERRKFRSDILEAAQATLQHVWKRLERGG